MLLAATAGAQQRTPGELSTSELITQTQAALEELTALEATALADWEAFERSEEDLRRAIVEIQKPLPDRPLPLTEISSTDPNYIQGQLDLAEEYRKAWEQRQGRYQAAATALAGLDSLRDNLHATYGPLLDRVEDLRPLLIESQRLLQRGDVKIADFKLSEGTPSIGDWIDRSAELVVQREELLGKVREMVTQLEEDRKAFAELPGEDPEQAIMVQRIRIGLSILAEAGAVADDQRQILANVRGETLPTEVQRAINELKGQQAALDLADKKCTTFYEALQVAQDKREALQTPQRDSIELAPGDEELGEVRRDVELARRMIVYYEQDTALQAEIQQASKALLELIEEATAQHLEFTYQVARVWATLEHARQLQEQGELADWRPPEGLSLGAVWDIWRAAQMKAFDRLQLAALSQALLRDETAEAADQALLVKERENLRQAEARLQTEISYSEFLTEMAELPQADLLALLGPEGEIAVDMNNLQAQMAELQNKMAGVKKVCTKALQAIHVIENPYAREALRDNTEMFIEQKASVEVLPEGQPLPDIQENLLTKATINEWTFPETLHNTMDKSAVQLAQEESDYLAQEQQFARDFLGYYTTLAANLEGLRSGVEQRRVLDQDYEDHINQRIRLEKRRYAAARQVRRHLRAGRLAAEQEPNELGHWLGRSDLQAADDDLRKTRQTNADFHARAAYEIERLEKLTHAGQWMKVRTDACTQRVRLVGRPVSLLTSALTPLNQLNEVDRQNLNYDAQEQQVSEDRFAMGLLLPFSRANARERFETPLKAYYLELANTHRVIRDLEDANEAYQLMTQASVQEKTDLQGVGPVFESTLAQRIIDYQTARYTVAVAQFPGQRARLEDAFRKAYGRELSYRLEFHEDNLQEAMNLLYSAQARLIGERRLIQGTRLLLSKVGLDQEIGWYGSQVARIGTLLDNQDSHKQELDGRIKKLRVSYDHFLQVNALGGLGIALTIPIITFLLVRVLRRLALRLEKRFAHFEGEAASDRQRRFQTVTKTVSAAISVLIWILALIYIFARLGLDVTPLIASASVMGFALAFGAQALVKDFFYGFFILIENQFTIGDIVALGDVTGTVEHITLRITVLRDLKGVVHYIPNGSIGQVSNKTQGWSRVVTEISVPHSEDPDRATQILHDVLQALAQDQAWAPDIIETPSVAGVENVTERSVDIRIMIKTRPGKQWAVAREARLRIKKRFDELGIAIPFPHRVVHHVYQDKDTPEEK